MKGKLSELEMLDLRAERALSAVDDVCSERDQLRLDLADARKQLDEAVGLVRMAYGELIMGSKAWRILYEYLARLDSEKKEGT